MIAIFIFILLVGLKYWQLILAMILLWYLNNKITSFFINKESKPKEFKAKTGKVYKQCSFCDAKADRMATHCPNCGNPFED